MKCKDKECGLEFDLTDADTYLEENYVELDYVDLDQVDISVSLTIGIACPDCGEYATTVSGEVNNLTVGVEEE